MKNILRKSLYLLVNIDRFFYLLFYKLLNNRKDRILIYTDSRGFEITKTRNRKHPRNSYVDYFVKNYNCDVHICPEKHTTFFDFFHVLDQQKTKYRKVICHVGVVDFSPRPVSGINSIFQLKKKKIEKLFGESFYKNLLNQKTYTTKYFNEETSAIIKEENIEVVANRLNQIDNLTWISCNGVDLDWRGNYKNNRPKNINIVKEKSESLIQLLKSDIDIIDLTKFTISEIKFYTCDNIHLSEQGMDLIKDEINKKI